MRSPLLAALASGLLSASAAAAPQLIIAHAKVFTADAARPYAEAVAIENGKISAVGADADVIALAGAGTRVIDAHGRLVAPGLIEAHVHIGAGFPLFPRPTVPLRLPGKPLQGPTAEQTLAAVASAAKRGGDWIVGFIGRVDALDQRNWRDALDAAAPNRPVMLRAPWGHTTILNSAALSRLGIADDAKDPIGGWWGRDAKGRLNGRAYESAEEVGWVRVAPPDPARLATIFAEAERRYARWGVTSIDLMNNGKTLALTAEALSRLPARQKWTVYSWAGATPSIAAAWAAMDTGPKKLPARVRIEGPKWLLDGTPLEQNALQRKPYPGRGTWRGRSNHTDAQLREILKTALGRPEQLILHVVGTAETDRLFAMMDSLAPAAVWAAKRVRVEHGDGIRPDTLAQAVRLGVVVTANPTHLTPVLPSGKPARPVADMPMLRSLLKAGVPLALGSDAGPPEVANPYLNIMLACDWKASPGESLSREEALRAYTAGGAYVERQENVTGRIVPGLAADLTMLSQDVLTIPERALPATTSLLTVVDGEIIFEDRTIDARAK